jgi:hypothetical protein
MRIVALTLLVVSVRRAATYAALRHTPRWDVRRAGTYAALGRTPRWDVRRAGNICRVLVTKRVKLQPED